MTLLLKRFIKFSCGCLGAVSCLNESLDVLVLKFALFSLVLTELSNPKRKFERQNRSEQEPELYLNGSCAQSACVFFL